MKAWKKIKHGFSPISKIDPKGIIIGHLDTLYDASSKYTSSFRVKWKDYLFFFGFPALFSIILFILYPELNNELDNIITTVFTIFISLLLSLLVLLYSMSTSLSKDNSKYGTSVTVLKQTVANVSFLIFISILSLFVLILWAIIGSEPALEFVVLNQVMDVISHVLVLIMYYLLCISGITILMVLKRMYRLITVSIENK